MVAFAKYTGLLMSFFSGFANEDLDFLSLFYYWVHLVFDENVYKYKR